MSESLPISPAELQPPATQERNFRLTVVNGVLFMFSDALFDPTLVVTGLVSQLTSSSFLLGLILPINNAGWYLPQFFTASWVQSLPRKIVAYQRMAFVRMACWLLLALSILLINDPLWILISLLVAYSIASIASGVSGLPFLETLGKTIVPARRGEVFAWRLGLGGLVGILAGLLVNKVLDPSSGLAFPKNYGLLALGFFIFASLSVSLYLRVEEPVDENPLPGRKVGEQFRIALGIWRSNWNYRKLVICQAMLFIGGAAAPFYAIYVQKEVGGSAVWIGVYIGVMMASNIFSNLLSGWISRRSGNRKVLVLGTGAGLIVSLLMLALTLLAKPLGLSPQAASFCLLPVFVLQGLRVNAVGISSPSLMLDLVPEAERSLMLGFTQTMMGIIILLTMLVGLVVDFAGYRVLMLISAVAYLASLMLALTLKERQKI